MLRTDSLKASVSLSKEGRRLGDGEYAAERNSRERGHTARDQGRS